MKAIKKYTKPEISLLKIDMESMLDTASPGYGGDADNTNTWDAKHNNTGFEDFDLDIDEEIYN